MRAGVCGQLEVLVLPRKPLIRIFASIQLADLSSKACCGAFLRYNLNSNVNRAYVIPRSRPIRYKMTRLDRGPETP